MSSTVIPNPQNTCVHVFQATDEQITFPLIFILCRFSFAPRSRFQFYRSTIFVSLFIISAPINTAMLNTISFLFHKLRCIFSESNETDVHKRDEPNRPSIALQYHAFCPINPQEEIIQPFTVFLIYCNQSLLTIDPPRIANLLSVGQHKLNYFIV